MKSLLTVCLMFLGIGLQAQTTTVRSQGSNVGNGGAYVAPVTTKTYTTPATPNKPYTPPAKTSNYNSTPASSTGSGSSTSYPASSGSGGGTYRSTEAVPDFGIKYMTNADLLLRKAIKDHNWDTVFVLFELRDYEFETRAGGGKVNAGYLLTKELTELSQRDYSVLPILYKTVYTKKLSYGYPSLASIFREIFQTDLSHSDFAVNKACLYVGDYQNAILNLRAHTMYGAKKPLVKRKNESYAGEYDKQELARNYVNYIAGRCFQELNMADSAKKYLALGHGYEEAWDKLYTECAAVRSARGH